MCAAIPVVDLGPLRAGDPAGSRAVIDALDTACRAHGFFYVTNHGVPDALLSSLDALSRTFFAQPEPEKLALRMALGGRAWRGYFPVGGELTSGIPDWKEGLYFGSEHADDHPAVLRGEPLHGRNLFPALPGFRDAVLSYMSACEALGQLLMAALSTALGHSPAAFRTRYLAAPITLFRIFHYPPATGAPAASWGVGEHTDYGLLTILAQDSLGGLEVRTRDGWTSAPPIPGTFVCNLGDMLESLSGGRYRSTPHRARNRAASGRLSFPFFFDPSWDAVITPDPTAASAPATTYERWDGQSVHAFEGTYGAYLLSKVSKVFPALRADVLADPAP